jgi:stage V sporulation protein SpoVS
MPRTAWADIGTYNYPIGAEFLPDSTAATISTIYGLTEGRSALYLQEVGANAIDQAITAYIKSGYFDIGDGDQVMYMKRFIPDFKNQVGDLTVHLLLRYYPQESANPSSLDPYTITPTTNKVDTRARGRQISLRIESDEVDSNWRYGTMRVDLQPDGLR